MPESNGTEIIGVIIGAISFVCGAALSLIGLGRKVERIDHSLVRCHERHDDHEKKFESFEQAIRTLTSVFTREDGEPRFITTIACGKEQVKCHESMTEKFALGAERFGRLESEVKEIKDAQHQNFQEIIAEIRKTR